MSLGSVFDSTPLEYRKISPGSKERADAPTQQMENFMDIVDLKQLMERALDHFVPPICALYVARALLEHYFSSVDSGTIRSAFFLLSVGFALVSNWV